MRKYLSMVAILSFSGLNAGEFQSLGGNSMGMGGAGVASASGSLAGYYNPALLTQKKGVEVSLGVGLGIREKNIGEQINTIADLELTDIIDRVANNAPIGKNSASDTQDIITAQNALKEIGDENGISIMPSAHFGVQYDNMAIGLYLTSDIVASAKIDQTRTDLIVENEGLYFTYNPQNDRYGVTNQETYEASSLQYALDNNLTTLEATGLALAEIPISYAHRFELASGELSVGGSLKLMEGTTYVQTVAIDDKDNLDSDTLDENQKDTSNVGIDLGLLFKPSTFPALTVGLVAKNINAPTFDTVEGGEIKVDPQVRTGVQYKVTDSVEIAGDLDLTTNKTLMNGYDSQMLGGGINYHPFLGFAFRAGAMTNLANSNDGLVYTAGLSIGFEKLNLDISAQMASNSGEYDGEDIPKYSKVNVALVSKW